MNNSKFIPALLIALLCYGQFVTSVHSVGHLHDNDCEVASGSFSLEQSSNDCATHQHSDESTHSALSDTHHDHSTHAEHTNDTEADCAIYHVLAGLDGLTDALLTSRCILIQPELQGAPKLVQFTRESLKHQPIRAPPAHS